MPTRKCLAENVAPGSVLVTKKCTACSRRFRRYCSPGFERFQRLCGYCGRATYRLAIADGVRPPAA